MRSRKSPQIFVALPILREFDNIEEIIRCIGTQKVVDFSLFVCVNQPDDWWQIPEKRGSCLDNQKTIAFLKNQKSFSLTIIDKSSEGKGWQGKKRGVGEARKLLFDHICEIAQPHDLIISLDADTSFSENYFEQLLSRFDEYPEAGVIAVPYYHQTGCNPNQNRALLYYEIYMRYYFLNLIRIQSPYAFTALGSALAFPVWSYRKVGGISPLEAGEDFYLLQKMCKNSLVLLWNEECVYPSGRISDRVPFGTGPAVGKDIDHLTKQYLFYSLKSFDKIKESYELFPAMYSNSIPLPIDPFMKAQLKKEEVWEVLRKNFRSTEKFVKACHERFDGLRIIQFLKYDKSIQPDIISNEECLIVFLKHCYGVDLVPFRFEEASLSFLSEIRNLLYEKEQIAREQHDRNIGVHNDKSKK